MIQNISIVFFDVIMEMKAHYLKSLKKSAVVDFMLYFTDFFILPDTSVGVRFSLDKWVVKYLKCKKSVCKDRNRKFTKKGTHMSLSIGKYIQSL